MAWGQCERGFGNFGVGNVSRSAERETAAAFLARTAAETPGELTVCAIEPLTNISLALDIDPNFIANLKSLAIMGGALELEENVTPHAEASFWNDPHAAQHVLKARGGGEVVIVGLDVTTKIALVEENFAALAADLPPETSLTLM